MTRDHANGRAAKQLAEYVDRDNMKNLFIWLALLAVITGCAANDETVLRNAAGEERYCYLVHDSTLAKIPATDQYNKCLNDAGAAGFKRVGTKSK